jgi:glycosyltransferase involved in cell wall biosynthesis
MLTDHDLICIAAVDWLGIRNRSQQLMTRFSRHNRVLYVNPPVSMLAPLREPVLANKRQAWKQGPVQVDENLYVLDLPMVLPFASRLPFVNAKNQQRVGGAIRAAVRSLGFRNPLLWTYLHTSADLIDKLEKSMVVYDCVDEHGAFPGHDPRVVAAMEDRLVRQADVVFTSARELYQKRKDRAKEIHLVPNGADLEHFARARIDDLPTPDDMAGIPGPVIGYVGFIHKWMNLEWIRSAAAQRSDWSFVLIGPVHTETGPLSHMENVHFLGEKPYAELPGYLRCFSACIIPFHRNALTVSVNPIKLYEYLAAGRPVVSAHIPELEAFADVVALVDSAEEFIQALQEQIGKNSPDEMTARQARVQAHSWDQRFAAMEAVLERKLWREP